jgi:predicted dehydrogenase
MDKLRIGVVGVGWVAQVFHLPILTRLEEAQVVSICDKDRGRADAIGERLGISRRYTDYEEMLGVENLDAVVVTTPTDLHKPVAIAALEAGRDVFVEKPIARHYSEAVEITETARAHKRKLMVGMNNRFRPDTMILKSFVENGEMGKIFYAKAGWLKKLSVDNPWITRKEKSGGGVFLDLGIVMLDLILWMTGFPEIVRVSSRMYHHSTKSVEDTCVVFLQLKSGVTVTIEVSWSLQSAEDFFYCQLFGSGGSAMINPLRILKNLHGNIVNVTPAKLESRQNLHKKSYENELKHFVGAARGLHPVVSTGEEAVHRMKIVDAIYGSSKRGKEIAF